MKSPKQTKPALHSIGALLILPLIALQFWRLRISMNDLNPCSQEQVLVTRATIETNDGTNSFPVVGYIGPPTLPTFNLSVQGSISGSTIFNRHSTEFVTHTTSVSQTRPPPFSATANNVKNLVPPQSPSVLATYPPNALTPQQAPTASPTQAPHHRIWVPARWTAVKCCPANRPFPCTLWPRHMVEHALRKATQAHFEQRRISARNGRFYPKPFYNREGMDLACTASTNVYTPNDKILEFPLCNPVFGEGDRQDSERVIFRWRRVGDHAEAWLCAVASHAGETQNGLHECFFVDAEEELRARGQDIDGLYFGVRSGCHWVEI